MYNDRLILKDITLYLYIRIEKVYIIELKYK